MYPTVRDGLDADLDVSSVNGHVCSERVGRIAAMHDDQLDQRLNAATPHVSEQTNRRVVLLRDVVAERVSRRRVQRPLIVGVASVLLVLGGTSTAIATAPFDFWFGEDADRTLTRVTSFGERCTSGWLVEPYGEGVTEDDPAVLAAREVLAAIDFNNLPITESELEQNRLKVQAEVDRRAALGHKRDLTPDPDGELISTTVATLVFEGVRARGLDPGRIVIASAGDCGDDSRGVK